MNPLSDETLPVPSQRILATATSASPEAVTSFEPDARHHALAGALFMADTPPTSLNELAALAGLKPGVVQNIALNPAACSWIVAHAAGIARFGLSAAYARLLHMALKANNPNWMAIFLKRFDPEYAQANNPQIVNNTQINNFRSYTTKELESFVKQKRRLKLGAEAEAS